DRLLPSDRLAVTGLGVGAPLTPFGTDHAGLKRALLRMTGQKHPRWSQHDFSLFEAQAIERGDVSTLRMVQQRECPSRPNVRQVTGCFSDVQAEGVDLARDAAQSATQTLHAIRDLLIGLIGIDAPKTLILLTEGFVLEDQAYVAELGSVAAAAR